ncbi:xanthine dehydrogenase-like [Atheta coriaria]|uniref:xanthine dehydrogenase-like n=1 Tax=Dalotia coriaria TaxID=877792 RepID=UPI0031F383BF
MTRTKEDDQVDASSVLVFYVNGKRIVDENVNPEWTLLVYLRNKLLLCGTKLGCGEGGCGACTVMVSKFDRTTQEVLHYPVNACLAPVCSMHGLAVTTVEGIGSTKTKLHPVQERIAKAHGTQCGFCTPGIVMSMYTLLRNHGKPKMEDLDVAFQGNLCRCTGYRPIIDGYKTFTEEWEVMQAANGMTNGKTNGLNGCGMGDKCCKLQNSNAITNGINGVHKTKDEVGKLFETSTFVPYDSSQEPIFPPELKLNDAYDKTSLVFKGENVTWYRPKTIEELLQLTQQNPGAKIIGGNTEVGVEVKFKAQLYPVYIKHTSVVELNQIVINSDNIRIGSAVTLDVIESTFKNLIATRPEWETRICNAVVEMLHWFAGKQIRCVATIGGNIMTGSPISDLNPIWIAIGARLHLRSIAGNRTVLMDNHFYTGYRKNIVNSDEILEAIEIPFTRRNQYVFANKQSRRRDDDIAIVNSALNLILSESPDNKIEDINMAFGGMAPTTIAVKKIKQLIGQKFDEKMLETAYQLLLDDLPFPENVPGGMISYRRSLAISFFFRSYLNISKQLNVSIDPKNLSALNKFTSKPPKSSQYFQVFEKEQVTDTIGRPIVHTNAMNQATGEAIYIDDVPIFEKELHLALIFSKKSHARILNVDISKALAAPHVVNFILPEDIPDDRQACGLMGDEILVRSDLVTSQYQVLGGILATNQLAAKQAVNLVQVTYEELKPVVTMDQAIEENCFYPPEAKLCFGNVTDAMPKCKNTISGEARTGYQEHFYLEPHAYLAIPREADEMEIYACSQDQTGLSEVVAKLLGVDQNKVIVKVKRIGGGFGGKETTGRKLALYVALAAKKTKRPVRLVLERDEDMGYTGGRNPVMFKYKLGFDDDGRIHAAEVDMFVNAGYSADVSLAVASVGITHVTNSTNIPNIRVIGKVCKTNLPTNTAMRAFVNAQTNFGAEAMLRDVAEYLNKDYVEIARLNLYKEGDLTIYNQPLVDCNVRRCFEEVLVNSDFNNRKKAVDKFNKENRWKKRGIDVATTTYGIGFGNDALQQAGALILIYKDGSVLLTHGGVEMGQGLHTKMIQVASKMLNIPIEKIHTTEASSDKVPNTTATVASMSSDLNGMAVRDACIKINNRLEPIKAKNPKGTWEEWIMAAYNQRISLSATGFHREPPVNWDWTTNTGDKMFNYFSFGAAVTEVEIDCLTGDHQLLRTDIVMDLGNSLNPAIDIGQIEGAFMIGYGLFVREEMVTLQDGTYLSKGPGAYKIPCFGDIPIEFNVALLKDSSNPRAVFSSKTTGEPPLCLATSTFFSIREAIKAARKDAGVTENFRMQAPATPERIRMACQDHLTKKVEPVKSTWNIEYI